MSVNHTHTSESIVQFEGVGFAYGPNQVLEGISFKVEKGDYLGLVGPNGGGKSTILKLLLGLEDPSQGRVRIFGQQPSQARQERSHIGYVPQRATQADFNFPLTVYELVALGLASRKSFFGIDKQVEKKSIKAAIETTGLSGLESRLVGELSGGQRQRALIARALAVKPEMLVLDEPTVGVDQASETQFYELLAQLNRLHGITIIVVSHDLHILTREAKTLLGVNKSLMFYGSPASLEAKGLLEILHR